MSTPPWTVDDRTALIVNMLGKPWVANACGPDAWDCYHLCVHVLGSLGGIHMSSVEVPNEPSVGWIAQILEQHDDRALWDQVSPIDAQDLSIVLMGRFRALIHMGVWFKPEGRVLHIDRYPKGMAQGVAFDDLPTLKLIGWNNLAFFQKQHAI